MAEVFFSFLFLLIFACCLFLFFGDLVSWRYTKKDLTKEYQMISQKEMALANELAEAKTKIETLEKQIHVAEANAIQDENRIDQYEKENKELLSQIKKLEIKVSVLVADAKEKENQINQLQYIDKHQITITNIAFESFDELSRIALAYKKNLEGKMNFLRSKENLENYLENQKFIQAVRANPS